MPPGRLIPRDYQPPLPRERFLVQEAPDDDAVPMDVVFVGGGPAGLAGAIRLAQLAQADPDLNLEIAVLEKAASLGEHCLSGAVINPIALRELFPDKKDSEFPLRTPVAKDAVYLLTEKGQIKFPLIPPTMHNHGNYVGSICELVRWLGEQAEALGVTLLPGYPVESLLVSDDAVLGVRTAAMGLDREGNSSPNTEPPTTVSARVTVLTEGTRGPLTQAWLEWQQVTSPNPQIFALGVKELWQTKKVPEGVIHTLGWPLPGDAFGGSFCYPMAENLVALGLVVGLDYRDATLDVHQLLQQLKTHPLFAPYLEGGELLEWGAKTIPEGGSLSFPNRMHGAGLLLAGDCVGMVNVPALKGIHYAMKAGMLAAETIYAALKSGVPTAAPSSALSAASLAAYDTAIRHSYIQKDLHATRNMRLAFKSGFYGGGFQSTLMSMTGGAFPGGTYHVEEDAAEAKHTTERPGPPSSRGHVGLSKVDAVFRSGNATRDDIPSHLTARPDLPREVAEMYAAMCPAGVYEWDGAQLVINAPNCIDCKATDVLGPRWSPREGGSGPKYQRM